MPVNEKAARRPEWREGTPVVLADGQEYQFPRPVVVFVPAETDIGFEVRAKVGDDGTLSRLLNALDGEGSFVATSLAVGRYLLLMNYDLTSEQIADVLQFSFQDDDSEGSRIRSEVMAVAWGRPEKKP